VLHSKTSGQPCRNLIGKLWQLPIKPINVNALHLEFEIRGYEINTAMVYWGQVFEILLK